MSRNGADGTPDDADARDELHRLRQEVQALRNEIIALKQQESRADTLQTMIFDDESEYIRFTDYVYDNFDGKGVELTNIPIATSIRVHSWLLDATRGQYSMRPVTEEDVTLARERFAGRLPFDPRSLNDFRVPGVSDRKRSA